MKNIKLYQLKVALWLLLGCFIPGLTQAQNIKGRVFEPAPEGSEQKYPAIGAFVHCEYQTAGVITDSLGFFELSGCKEASAFVVEHVMSQPLRVEIKPGKSSYTVYLESSEEVLKAAVATGKIKTYGLKSLDPKTTINLNEREFQKAACCNLSESFENAPAIDVNFGDAVTGTRQIKMLGLDGFYSMISREYMPSVRLLNSYYGMSFIPAAWVKGIQITKGAGSVVNGYESIAGQINIEMKKPFDTEKILFDQFISESGRSETDVMYRKDISRKLATSFFARAAFFPIEQDRNGDGFLDNPTGNQFQVMNRWQFYDIKDFEGELSVAYNKDTKVAGEMEGDLTKLYYNINIDNEQFDIWAKLGKIFPEKPYQSFGSQYGFNQSKMRSVYGYGANSFDYDAQARSFYANVMFQSIIKTTTHGYKIGLSEMLDQMEETVQRGWSSTTYQRTEAVTGAFAEYTWQPSDEKSIVLGLRTDYNNLFGWSVTPRMHSKFRFNKQNTTFRASAGTGRRTSNVFGQNQQMFASSRMIEVVPSNLGAAYGLDQEVAINAGMSLEHKMKFRLQPLTLLVDFFHTTFLNEVVFDRETDSIVRFYNMTDGTRANSLQVQLDYQPLRRTEIRLAYRMFDVETKFLDGRRSYMAGEELTSNMAGRIDKPFVARHRGFLNITQNTRKSWQFSTTFQVYGKQRIPGFKATNTIAGTQLDRYYSPAFVQLNAQVSKQFKSGFESFIGVENVLNYRQENPIINADQPFSAGFDASLVWGPVFGRMLYGGFRWRISNK